MVVQLGELGVHIEDLITANLVICDWVRPCLHAVLLIGCFLNPSVVRQGPWVIANHDL